ncbi:MAG: hypothetical protein UIC63_04770 [Bacteroidaceae bacterium]|nr:hypothetical protein [Bacteroidaceae bacterium]
MKAKEIVKLLEKEREVYAEVVKVMNENELTNGQGLCIVMRLAFDIIRSGPLPVRVEMAKDFEEFSTAMREGFEREIVNREKDGE